MKCIMSSLIFEFEDGLGTQKSMIEVIRYKLKDMVRRKFDLCYGYQINKWRNKLKFLGYFVLCNTCRQVLNTLLRLGQ